MLQRLAKMIFYISVMALKNPQLDFFLPPSPQAPFQGTMSLAPLSCTSCSLHNKQRDPFSSQPHHFSLSLKVLQWPPISLRRKLEAPSMGIKSFSHHLSDLVFNPSPTLLSALTQALSCLTFARHTLSLSGINLLRQAGIFSHILLDSAPHHSALPILSM